MHRAIHIRSVEIPWVRRIRHDLGRTVCVFNARWTCPQSMLSVFLFLFFAHAALPLNLLHTFEFPSLPYIAGVRYIHSPQKFLPAHGICWPHFCVENVSQPMVYTRHRSIALRYRTLTGSGRAHVLSNVHNMTQFLLVDDDGRTPCVIGHLRIKPLTAGGFALRCFVSNLRPTLERQLSMVWEGRFAMEREVEKAIRRSSDVEDASLRAFADGAVEIMLR